MQAAWGFEKVSPADSKIVRINRITAWGFEKVYTEKASQRTTVIEQRFAAVICQLISGMAF